MNARVNSNATNVGMSTSNQNKARKWLREHVSKNEHATTKTACQFFGVETQDELFERIDSLYPKGNDAANFKKQLKSNDDAAEKRLRNVAKRQKQQKSHESPKSVLQTKLNKLKNELLSLQKQEADCQNKLDLAMQAEEKQAIRVSEIEKEVARLQNEASTLLNEVATKKAQVQNLEGHKNSIVVAIGAKENEIAATLDSLKELDALHISFMDNIEGIDMYSQELPTLQDKFAIIVEMMQDPFVSELMNMSTQEDNLLAVEILFCYRKVVAQNSDKKVYWHIKRSNVSAILETFVDEINLVIEESQN